jgi:hypothetical protein
MNNKQAATMPILQKKKATVEEALRLFDASPSVSLEFMKGRWKGYEISTGHPIDGLLEASGWYGKLFVNAEEVHPLLFLTLNKSALYAVNPMLIPLNINFPKWKILKSVMALLRPVLNTKKAKARMRMVSYRGKLTGAMVYDHKAIIDVFAKIDERTMLGVMDRKGESQPYIFVLERDDTAYNRLF